jgi:hypothetical protein
LVATVLALALATQAPQLQVRVDPTDVLLGDTVVFTITVSARGDVPVEIVNPSLSGLQLQSMREQASVSVDGGVPMRLMSRHLVLRTIRVGEARIGAVEVRQDAETLRSDPRTVTVRVAGAGERSLAPRLRELIERTQPPPLSPDEVSVSLLYAPRSVLPGEQLDLLVVAWFPRGVRSRLRQPPTLRPPQLQGAWSYHRPTPTGIALSRQVGGVWYDLFVHHQAVFPLTAGELAVGAATVTYDLPLTHSFLSRELRHEVESQRLQLAVRQLPPLPDGRGFQGATGVGLSLDVDVPIRDFQVGSAVRVRAVVSGGGNVALWPEPAVEWPPGMRAYPGDVQVDVSPEDGRVGGRKTFHYTLVPDSAGAYRLAGITYPYFDTESRRHVVLRAAPIQLTASGGSPGGAIARGAAGPLAVRPATRSLDAWLARAPWWAWLLVMGLPPLLAGGARWARRRRRAPAAAPDWRERSGLPALDREFRTVLEGLVADAGLLDGDGLADALRAAGVDAPVAAHSARVRDRLRLARYGPEGATDSNELEAEVREVLRALLGRSTEPHRLHVAAAVILLAAAVARPAVGQSPEQLLEAGAGRAAADSFAARAAGEPLVAAHWYNLGVALERSGEVQRAHAAWIRAGRLAPRDRSIRDALGRRPPPDRDTARLTWISPVAPAEALAGALALWVLGWALAGVGVRRRHVAIVMALVVLVAGYALVLNRRYAGPVALARLADTPLREAPYGSAPAPRTLADGAAVTIVEERGPWVLARRGAEAGWVLRDELVRL